MNIIEIIKKSNHLLDEINIIVFSHFFTRIPPDTDYEEVINIVDSQMESFDDLGYIRKERFIGVKDSDLLDQIKSLKIKLESLLKTAFDLFNIITDNNPKERL